MPEPSPSGTSEKADIEAVAEILSRAYRMCPTEITRLPIGQGTINYRAVTAQRSVFVKHYPAGTDLAAELSGVELSVLAGRHGVPVADLLPAADGEPIVVRGTHAISVCCAMGLPARCSITWATSRTCWPPAPGMQRAGEPINLR